MIVDSNSVLADREWLYSKHATAAEECTLTTLWMARGILYIFGGVGCLAAWAGNGEPTYFIGALFGLGFGIWSVWSSDSTSKEDEEGERTAPSRIESATAGLESAWGRRDGVDRSKNPRSISQAREP